MEKKKLIVVLIGALALLALILFQTGAFSGGRIAPGRTRSSAPTEKEARPFTVTEQEIPIYYHAVGTVHSRTEVELAARITARIVDVKARSGDRVKKGEVLIRLDKSDLDAQLSGAEEGLKETQATIKAADQEVNKATANLKLATANLKRDKLLFEKKVVPQKVLDQTVSNFEQAQSSLSQSEQNRLRAQSAAQVVQATVREAKAKLDYATIKSPFDGIVAKQLADPGDLASPGIILMTVFDPTRIMFYVPISESLVQQIKIGEKIPLEVPAIKKSVEGEIREIVPAIDPGSRTFLTKICINKTDQLMPGMFGSLNLKIGTEKALLIPRGAITRVGQLEYVQLLGKDGSRIRQLIRTVKYDPTQVQVISGLKAGDVILM